MRAVSFPMLCISIALLATGCGHTAVLGTQAPTAAQVAAQDALVETGPIPMTTTADYKTIDIMGIGTVQAAKLASLGITTATQLLTAGASRTGRLHLATQTGISDKLILTWVNACDLMRVLGCGPEYARLLGQAGVDTVPDLATRNPANLAAKLPTVNSLGGGHVCVHRLPDAPTLAAWIAAAKADQRIVTY